jgi:hypothetical protein
MERVLLKEDNYLEWTDYIRNELLARGLWNIVLGIKQKSRKPVAPKTAAAGGATGKSDVKGKAKEDDEDGPKPGSAAAILANAQLQVEAEMVSETTPESDEAVYMSDFRRYMIQRDTYLDDVGKATAEIRRSLHPSLRRRYNDKLYDASPALLWKAIEKDCNRVAEMDGSVGLYKLNAIKRVDFESATAYHSRILEIATELRNAGTELSEAVLAFFMIQGLPTGDVWLAFKHSLAASKANKKCQDVVEQLQTFERSYAYDRHGASAYTNSELSTALFAKKGTGGGSKKKDGKVSGGDRDKDSSKTIKCFGCGKKGHKKFECRSKHLWKENGRASTVFLGDHGGLDVVVSVAVNTMATIFCFFYDTYTER